MNTSDISPIIHEKAPLILAEIQKAASILLHCHPSPDPDSVGSALAMKFALEQLGKKVTVIQGDSNVPRGFIDFPGVETVTQKNFSEVDLKEFDLFIILDSGSPGMISRIELPVFPLSIKTIIIDHHASNLSYADINLVDVFSPATAFILVQLFKEWSISLNREIALNLFMGMYTDTGGFQYRGVTYQVLAAASECARIAPDFPDVIFTMNNSNMKESLYFEASALSSVKTYLNDNVAIANVSLADLESKDIPVENINGEGIANRLKSVIGWNVGILMIEVAPNRVKINFRTRDSQRFDVSKLAVILGGGGHRSAAGATLSMPLPEAISLVVAKAKELYNL